MGFDGSDDGSDQGGTGGPGSVPGRSDHERLDPGAFRTIVEASDDGIVTFDAERRITYVNPVVEGILELDDGAIVGRTPQEISEQSTLTIDGAREIEAAIDEVVRHHEEGRSVERSLEFSGGIDRTVELQITPLPDDADAGDVVATVRDVTDRTSAETQLRESRRKIEQLHEAATEIVASRTEEEAAERAVRAAEEILEFDVCSLTLKRGEWFVPVAVSSESPEGGVKKYREDEGLLGKTYQTGESQRVADVHANSETEPADDAYRSGISVPIGEIGVFQATSTEVDWFDGDDVDLAETLMAHVAETIRRINTESELREREQDLVAERDRLAALFENVPDPVVAFDLDGGKPIVTDVNEPFEAVFGYSADEVVGNSLDDYIIPEGHEIGDESINEALRGDGRLQTVTQRETADGRGDFLLTVAPFLTGEDDVQGYAIYTDITEQKERQRELERQNERLEEFASIVSHDLRNPLSVAEGYLELAAETGSQEYVEQVADAHDRMRRMIDELLALARKGEVVGDTRDVELSSAIERAWEAVDGDGVTLTVDGDATVEADHERLVELFENLFRNAVEHAAGDDGCRIRVGVTDRGFYIADDGPGLDAADPQAVFESGYTTADDGTGFGLAIVERIANAHDWTVEAGESEAGGARFDVRTE